MNNVAADVRRAVTENNAGCMTVLAAIGISKHPSAALIGASGMICRHHSKIADAPERFLCRWMPQDQSKL